MMPSFRKLSPAELAALHAPTLGTRAQIALEYDSYLADFVVGDHGSVELTASEARLSVRSRLHAAARRRGLALRFRPGPGLALIFRVNLALPPVSKPTLPPVTISDQQRSGAVRHTPEPPRPPRRRKSSAERYREVLPRWMRDGQQASRRGGSKRRSN